MAKRFYFRWSAQLTFRMAVLFLAAAEAAAQSKIDPKLRQAASQSAEVDVVVIHRYQPQERILDRAWTGARLELAEKDLASSVRRRAQSSEIRANQERLEGLLLETRRGAMREIEAAVAPSQARLRTQLGRLGARSVRSFRAINMFSATIPVSSLAALEADPDVAEVFLAEPHYTLLATSAPSINAPALWQHGITGAGQSVAVLDTGIRPGHPAFSGTEVVGRVFHQAGVQSPCYADDPTTPVDLQGHGTHVAGIVASRGAPGFDRAFGVAPGLSRLFSMKVGYKEKSPAFDSRCSGLGSFAYGDTFEAIDWLLENTPVRIINYSAGGKTSSDDDPAARVYDYLADRFGLTVVIAAGNFGPGPRTLGSPGIAYNAITVANADDRKTPDRGDDRMADGSSRGPTAGGRFKPDITAPGTNIFSAAYNSSGFVALTGTSMAAPHVAGAAALLSQMGITDSRAVKALLINTSGFSGWEPDRGWGYANLANLAAAPHHFLSAAGPGAAGARYFKGPVQRRMIATLAWNRHVALGANNQITTAFNDLNLYLYSELNNTLLSKSDTAIQNVEQVFAETSGDVVLKVRSARDSLAGIDSETFALAVSGEGFTEVAGPRLEGQCSGPATAAPGARFTVTCTVSNAGGLEAFGVRLSVQGQSVAEILGNIGAEARVQRSLTLTAPATVGSATFRFLIGANSYGESQSATAELRVTIAQGGVAGLVLDRTVLNFEARVGGAAPAAQEISITSAGSSAAAFTAAVSERWLSVTPAQGATPARLRVSINPSGLAAGVHQGAITLRSGPAVHTVAVSLRTVSATDGMPKVEKIIVTSDRPSSSGCTEPPAAERVLISDEQVFVWFLVSGVRGGDTAGVEWRQPDGRTYSSGRWNPFPNDGTWCLFTSMQIAGNPPAETPGAWSVQMRWNGAVLVTHTVAIERSAILAKKMFTAALPSGNNCPEPRPALEFHTSDEKAHVWFLIRNGAAGDVARVDWVGPDGAVVEQRAWRPLAGAGNWCFYDTLDLAGKSPGIWNVRVTWNGAPLFSDSFVLKAGASIEFSTIARDVREGGCYAPPAETTFSPWDSRVLVWFSVSDVVAGDRPSVKWIQPDGRAYFTYTWDPSEPGNRCFWAWIRIAGFAAAGLPGAWKAEVSWNGKKAVDLAFGIAPLIPSERVFTKEPSSGSCTPPLPAASFRTTDAMAALWFRVERARAGDVLRTEWVAPDGSVVRRSQFIPIARDGNWCFRSTLPIANAPASEMPGTWTVRVFWENVQLFSSSFEIEDDNHETDGAPPSMQGMSRAGAVSFAEESAPVLIDAAPPPPQTLTGMGAGAGSGGAAAEGARSRQLR